MAQPIITIIGTVATPPDTTVTKRGTPLTAFRLAQTERRFNPRANRWEDGTTSWYSVTCWRSWGENVAQSLGVGDPVVVCGRLKVREFKVEGETYRQAEIDASTVGHDIRRGISRFTKVNRPAADFVDEDDEVSSFHNRLAQQYTSSPWSEPARAEGQASQPRDNESARDDSRPAYGLDAPSSSSASADEPASADAEKQAA